MNNNKLRLLRNLMFLLLAVPVSLVSSCTSRTSNPVAATPETTPVSELIANADKIYEQREELTHVREALSLLRRGRTVDFQNYEVAWRIAKVNYYLGAHTKDSNERDNAFREGVESGQAAVNLQPDKPEGHFWFGANMGGRAQASALSGVADAEDIRREMEAVIKIDEKYEWGSAYMVLGQVDLELPRIMGGDPTAAVKTLEKGLRFGDDNALLRLRLAEGYIATGRKEDARKQLDTIITMKPNPHYVPEHKEAVEEARKLIETRLN